MGESDGLTTDPDGPNENLGPQMSHDQGLLQNRKHASHQSPDLRESMLSASEITSASTATATPWGDKQYTVC